MNFALLNVIYTIVLLIGMMIFLEIGRRIALRRMAADSDGARVGIGTVEGALLALLGSLIGLGFYATPSTDAALSNVPDAKAGAASGIYKMASSLGAAFGVAISAALFTALGEIDTGLTSLSDLFLGRTDNVSIRFAAGIALLFNVLMVVVAIIAIILTVPKDDPRDKTPAIE